MFWVDWAIRRQNQLRQKWVMVTSTFPILPIFDHFSAFCNFEWGIGAIAPWNCQKWIPHVRISRNRIDHPAITSWSRATVTQSPSYSNPDVENFAKLFFQRISTNSMTLNTMAMFVLHKKFSAITIRSRATVTQFSGFWFSNGFRQNRWRWTRWWCLFCPKWKLSDTFWILPHPPLGGFVY